MRPALIFGGVRLALYNSGNDPHLRLELGADALGALDLAAGEHVRYAWSRTADAPLGRLLVQLCDDGDRPRLFFRHEGRIAATRLGHLPKEASTVTGSMEGRPWHVDCGHLVVELPTWFYGLARPPLDEGEQPAWVPSRGRFATHRLTPADKRTIRARVEAGETQVAVAADYGLTTGQVSHVLVVTGYRSPEKRAMSRMRLSSERLAPVPPSLEKKRRPCLRCRAAFWSDGPGNRMCDPCRRPSGLSAQFEAASI